MTTPTTALRDVIEALERATPGPWQVLTDKIAWSLKERASTGEHIHRRIFTAWDHPQAKGPLGVVNIAAGIGDQANGGAPVYFVQINEGDADLIVSAVNFMRTHGRRALAVMEAVEAAPVVEVVGSEYGASNTFLKVAVHGSRGGEFSLGVRYRLVLVGEA